MNDWSRSEVAERLRLLREDHAAWRLPRDTGQFSLAGAQPKTALLLQNDRWGIPSGRIPTTHILKPPTGHFDGHAENEHICLMLARNLGLPAAQSKVMRFKDEVAISVHKQSTGSKKATTSFACIRRISAKRFGIMPTKKYQNEGGPSPVDLVEFLRTYSTDRDTDLDTFGAALGFNWLIAGTDAHAKNYSLLLSGSDVRLAPLYDIASILPYDEVDLRKVKLAMKIGGEYKVELIGLRQWQKFAREVRTNVDQLVEVLISMAKRLPDEVSVRACARSRRRIE